VNLRVLLVEPYRQAVLPSNRVEWLDRHLARLCVRSELTQTQYRNAEDKYSAVGDWLAASGSSLAIFEPEVYPQGSMLLGTTVRPDGRIEYDLDLVCQLHYCAHQPPLTIYDWVHSRMISSDVYREMLEKLNRCLRLNYAGDFHLDILPACPNVQLGNGSIIVPDRKLECWKHSNPKGFAAWFFERCRLRDELAERMLRDSVEPLPSAVPSESKFPLQRIVQLMKRHRDIFFHGGRDIARSVIVTTLAGSFYGGQRSLSLALESVLDGIHDALEACPQVPRILNPVHTGENFADTWDQERYDKFKSYIRNFRRGIKAALYPMVLEERQGLEKTAGSLSELFGADRVKDAIRIEANELNELRNSGTLGIGSGGLLTALTRSGSAAVPRNQFFGQ
jgi:Second Messenger Oligonucleotide or Dinucleotide Synthetase domain